MVDVGCGTGISTLWFAERGLQVTGVDANEDMLGQAELSTAENLRSRCTWTKAPAENTGLANQSADLVLSAQAFHWFKPEEALNEFFRILKPGAYLCLMWNERDESDVFSSAYGDMLRTYGDAERLEVKRIEATETIKQYNIFPEVEKYCFPHEQIMNHETLLARVFSTSYMPRPETASGQSVRKRLDQLHAELKDDNGVVTLKYQCSVYLAPRPANSSCEGCL